MNFRYMCFRIDLVIEIKIYTRSIKSKIGIRQHIFLIPYPSITEFNYLLILISLVNNYRPVLLHVLQLVLLKISYTR